MNINGMNRIPAKRFRGAGIHGNFSFSYGSENSACVRRRLSQRHVAVDSAHSEKVQTGVVSGQEDGEGILRKIEQRRAVFVSDES